MYTHTAYSSTHMPFQKVHIWSFGMAHMLAKSYLWILAP